MQVCNSFLGQSFGLQQHVVELLLYFLYSLLYLWLTELQRKEEARIAKERKELAWRRDHAYDDIMSEENLAASSNQDRDEDFLDDFM